MTLSPPGATDWVMDSDASSHMTPDSGNISLFRPPRSTSIMVGNGSTLPVTTSRHSIIPGPFYLNNILVARDIVQSLISVRWFTSDNNSSVEFDPLGLFVKDLHSRSVIARYNSSGPLYTLGAPTCSPVSRALVAPVSSNTWHRRLGHPRHEALSKLTSTSAIDCNKITSDSICHACQVERHTRLPFANSTSRALKNFDLIHCDLWTSPISSVSGYKYYLTILDDCWHFLWTFPLHIFWTFPLRLISKTIDLFLELISPKSNSDNVLTWGHSILLLRVEGQNHVWQNSHRPSSQSKVLPIPKAYCK
jgi:hypothetical protein